MLSGLGAAADLPTENRLFVCFTGCFIDKPYRVRYGHNL